MNAPQDPIINACRRLGLNNTPENKVKVIFVPAMLNGEDGFLNMPYEEVISACGMGCFPSWYEPWGYTPQESAAPPCLLTTGIFRVLACGRAHSCRRGRCGRYGVCVMPRRGMN